MPEKLPVIKIFKDSLLHLKNNLGFAVFFVGLTTIYYVLRKSVYFSLGYYDIDLSKVTVQYVFFAALLILKYFLLYFLVRRYFEQKPLFSTKNLFETLKKAAAIFILYMAIAGALIILFTLLKKAFIPEFVTQFLSSEAGVQLVFLLSSVFSIFVLVIPSFAWVSSVISKDSSVTASFFKVSGNYFRLIVVFVAVFFIIAGIRYVADESFDSLRDNLITNGSYAEYYTLVSISSMATNLILSILFLLIEALVYLQVYQFFYKDEA